MVRHCNGLHVWRTSSTHVKTISGSRRYYGCKVCDKDRPSAPSWCPTPWWLPHWNKLYRKGEKRLHTRLSEKSGCFLHAPWIDDCKKEEFSWENWVLGRRCHVRTLFYYLAPVSSSKSLPAVNTHINSRCLRAALKQHYFTIHSCSWEDVYQHCAQAKMIPPNLERCGSSVRTRKGCQGFDQ